MKTFIRFVLLIGIMMIAGQVFAIDYGTPVSIQGAGRFSNFSSIDWSPDGKWIAFSASIIHNGSHSVVTHDGTVLPDRKSDIWMVSSQGGIPEKLTNGYYGDDYVEGYHYPDFTSDSNEVKYSKWLNLFEEDGRRQEFTIESINIHNGEQRVILEKNSLVGFWNDDDQYMVYVDMTDNPEIDNQDQFAFTVLDFDNNDEVYRNTFPSDTLPRFCFGISCFSPDNAHFITTLLEKEPVVNDYQYALYKIPLDGGEPEILISEGTPFYPRYSPGGKWILYTNWYDNGTYHGTNNGPYPHQFGQLCVYNTETGEIIVLLPDCPYWNCYGRWSPDGTQICYILKDEDHCELRIIDFEFAEEEIQVSAEGETPTGFALKGNYPNPFNPSTTIEFSLHETGFAELTVYNLAGQKVLELVSGTLSEGIHSVVWNGLNDNGLPVSAGLYMSQLTMGNAVTTSRMMLVK